MDMRKGPMKYVEGGTSKLDTTQYDKQNMMDFDNITVPEGATEEDSKSKKKPKKKEKKKPVKKNMGGMMKYANGGKVRGHGMARGGRPCKMVSMKGS
jgi:hypothetical protein